MYFIEADENKNRLYLRLGTKSEGDVETFIRVLKDEISKLTPGFTVLTDLSDYMPLRQVDAQFIITAQEIMIKKGMGMSARVANSAVVKMQMERRAKETEYPARTVSTIVEAEAFLDAWQAGIVKKSTGR